MKCQDLKLQIQHKKTHQDENNKENNKKNEQPSHTIAQK
jgi:hypothetical protein